MQVLLLKFHPERNINKKELLRKKMVGFPKLRFARVSLLENEVCFASLKQTNLQVKVRSCAQED